MGISAVFNYLMANPAILIVIFLLYCFIYALSIMFSGPKPGRNPFSSGHVRPPPALVTDHKLRKKILKQRFKPQNVPDNIDTIVIGSGIGGLTTAVLLGRAGYKVLVLEQHDQAGGCCHTFVEKGFEFDTGIHYIGKMMDGDMTRVLIDQITEGQVVWVPMHKEFDTVAIGPAEKPKFYSMVSGSQEEFANNLKRQFPSESAAVDKYMKLLADCRGTFLGVMIPKVISRQLAKIAIKTGLYQLYMHKFMRLMRLTVKEALDQISDNEEFKAVVSYIFGDMGAMPSELSMMGFAQLINHYIPGAFYPLGGTSEIAFQIIPIIEKYGGRVLVDAPVTKILINENGRAHGVRIKRSSGDIDLYAKKIISDAGILNTFKTLLPKEVAVKAPVYKLLGKDLHPSISYLTVFIGLDGSSEELQLPTGNTWAFRNADYESDLRDFTAMTVEEAADSDIPLMFISYPSAKDPAWDQKYPGKSVLLVITLLPWPWFSQWESGKVKHRGEEYDSLKDRIGHQLWKQVQQMYPHLSGKMEYIDVGSPLSNKFYLGQPEGEMYGLDHGRSRFEPDVSMDLRPQTGIPGLYLTGQDILTCGFSGAMHAGVMTAAAILHRNLLNDLTTVTKDIRKINKMKKTQ